MSSGLHVPPEEVARSAERGLALRERFGRGGTEVGVSRALRLVAREPLDMREVRVISGWFARIGALPRSSRHAWGVDENPSAGWIAWLLWGGDEGRAWADRLCGKAVQPVEGEERLLADLERLGL